MIRAAGRRLRLEIRRNEFRWLFLLVAVGTGLALSDRVGGATVGWATVSLAWRDALYVLGPWTGAAAAWTAGRERRHDLDELLATTARPPFRRRLWALAGVAALGTLAFAAVGGWLALAAASRASGGPMAWAAILVAWLGLLAFAAAGFALGVWQPRRATAFGAMLGFALLQLALAAGRGAGAFLTAVPRVHDAGDLGLQPDLAGRQALFLLGLIGLALALLARSSDDGRRARLALAGSALLVLLAGAAILRQDAHVRAVAEAFAPASPAASDTPALR